MYSKFGTLQMKSNAVGHSYSAIVHRQELQQADGEVRDALQVEPIDATYIT